MTIPPPSRRLRSVAMPLTILALCAACGSTSATREVDDPTQDDDDATGAPEDPGREGARDGAASAPSPIDAGGDAGASARDGGPPLEATRDGAVSGPIGKPDATAPQRDATTAADAATGPATGCSGEELAAVLKPFVPSDEENSEAFAEYLGDELGAVTCATEGSGGKRTITQTIFVPPGAVYDGKGETLTADVAAMKCDTSEGEQAESQRPYFLLAPGAQLKNVTITYPGCEGVHMMGDNVLDNIVWEDAGEDAASVRSYFPGGKIEIKNSKGHKASDKMFQFNAPCDIRVENFSGSDMGKLIRQNGGTSFKLTIDLNTVNVTGVVSAVVQSDSEQCFVRHHALTYAFAGSGDKSDRVFRDIPPANVTAY